MKKIPEADLRYNEIEAKLFDVFGEQTAFIVLALPRSAAREDPTGFTGLFQIYANIRPDVVAEVLAGALKQATSDSKSPRKKR